MEETVKQLGEKRLLQRLRKYIGETSPIVRAFSEDCAVIDTPGNLYQLMTVDVLVEGQHFSCEWMPPYFVGRKAVKVNLSDISAMGGRPLFFMVSLGLPPETAASEVEEIYNGMESASQEGNILLAGGNVSASSVLFVDIMMVGEVAKDLVLMRNGARAGDAIFVTGALGIASAGLNRLRRGFRPSEKNIPTDILAQWDPPNLNILAQKLAGCGLVTSMMDLSDGLSSDLPEICRESGVGALIELEKLPATDTMLALTGGEDYHLLFTVSGNRLLEFTEFQFPVFQIGKILDAGEGIFVLDNAGRRRSLDPGFEHFE